MILRPTIVEAYDIALKEQKPFLRLCANLMTTPPVPPALFSAIREIAQLPSDDGQSLFMIGPYAGALQPDAEKTLAEKNFPYNYLRVDGVCKNGATNIALWLTRDHIEKTNPAHIAETFHETPGLEVLARIESYDELPARLRTMARDVGSRKPVFAKILYTDGKNALSMTYTPLPPAVLSCYGEDPAPELYTRMMDAVASGEFNLGEDALRSFITDIRTRGF